MPVRPPAGPEAHARGGPEVISEIFLNKYESTFVLSKVHVGPTLEISCYNLLTTCTCTLFGLLCRS